MASWLELESLAPDIARAGRARLEECRVALLGTLRPDGSPRISPVEPCFAGGELLFGVMAWSGKAHDLRRDPRCVLHSPIAKPDAGEIELKLYGRTAPAGDRLREACEGAWWLHEPRPPADVHAVDVTEAVLITWDLVRGIMDTVRWSPLHGLGQRQRPYP